MAPRGTYVAMAIVAWFGWLAGAFAVGLVLAAVLLALLVWYQALMRRPEPPRVAQARPRRRSRWYVGATIPLLGVIRGGIYRRIGR